MDAWREKVIVEAESWLRTPWHHRAYVKGVGVDCAQFLRMVYINSRMIEPFDTGEYPDDWMLHEECERFLGWLERYMVPTEAPEPADVVLWKFGRAFSHAAIVVQWPKIIHAYRKQHMVVYGDAAELHLAKRASRFYMLKAPA